MTQTIIAQITDLHIRQPGRLAYGRLNTAPYLTEAVKSIKQLRQKPDVLLMTGDLTDFGRTEEYEHLKELIGDLGIPFTCCLAIMMRAGKSGSFSRRPVVSVFRRRSYTIHLRSVLCG